MKQKIKILIVNILLTCVSLAIALPIATSLCDSTVESFSEGKFAYYLEVITPEIFLLAFLFFAFDAVYSIFHSHNKIEKEYFLQTRKKEVKFWKEILHIVINPNFLAETAVFAAVCLLSERFGIIHFILLLLVSTMRKSAIHRKWYVRRKKPNPKGTFRSILREFASLFFQIFLLIFFLPLAMPFLWMFIEEYEFFAKVILFILAVFFFTVYVRAIKKRLEFIKKLRALCAEKGYKISEIKSKYSFIFGRNDGANFKVYAHGKIYTCKFIAGKIFGVPIIFCNDGEGNFNYILKVRGAQKVGGAPLISIRTYFEYCFEAEENEQKILICSPLPIQMSIEEHGRQTVVSSGASIWGYKLFSASNFLRCLEYDVVEK